MSKEFDKQWVIERIKYYNKKASDCYDNASKCEGDAKEYCFDEAHIYAQAVSFLENGAPPPKALPTETYFIEEEDDSCAGGACKI